MQQQHRLRNLYLPPTQPFPPPVIVRAILVPRLQVLRQDSLAEVYKLRVRGMPCGYGILFAFLGFTGHGWVAIEDADEDDWLLGPAGVVRGSASEDGSEHAFHLCGVDAIEERVVDLGVSSAGVHGVDVSDREADVVAHGHEGFPNDFVVLLALFDVVGSYF